MHKQAKRNPSFWDLLGLVFLALVALAVRRRARNYRPLEVDPFTMTLRPIRRDPYSGLYV